MTARKSLRDRLAQARSENYIDLRVTTPGFEGLFVRCRAMQSAELNTAIDRHAGKPDAGIAMGIDILAATCMAVWEDVDGKGVSPVEGFSGLVDLDSGAASGDFPTFASPELAEAFGLDEPSAEAIILALLAPTTSLRLMPYSDALQEFSVGSGESVVRTARGN